MDSASEILANKNSGPSGVLAFMMANAHISETSKSSIGKPFTYFHPVSLPSSPSPEVPYYGIINNNRVGLEVSVPPGGTQDLIFDLDGVETYAELVKPKKQFEFIRDNFGVEIHGMSDDAFVFLLQSQSRVQNLRLEDAFSAAVRETAEEHGWNYVEAKDQVLWIEETDQRLLSKRSFATTPPTPVLQKIFVAQVLNFDWVEPIKTDKIETKIPSRMGCEFFEQGDFQTLAMLQANLVRMQELLAENPDDYSDIAHIDVKATASRVEMIERIERDVIRPRLG